MNWSRDLTYALRQLRRATGFAASAMLTLGLGIGVTTAVFTVASTMLLRPPVRRAVAANPVEVLRAE